MCPGRFRGRPATTEVRHRGDSCGILGKGLHTVTVVAERIRQKRQVGYPLRGGCQREYGEVFAMPMVSVNGVELYWEVGVRSPRPE